MNDFAMEREYQFTPSLGLDTFYLQRQEGTTDSGLAQECETLRHQNTDLRRGFTMALADSNASKGSLREAQAFERIGRAAAGVAHDFNNFITGIIGIVSEINDDLGPASPHHAILEIAMMAAQKAGSLSKRLLSTDRSPTESRQTLDLNQVIQGMQPILRRLLGPGNALEVVLECSLGLVRAEQSQMEQVILNLVVNARDAMPEGGKVTLKTSLVGLSDPLLGRQSFIQLTVSDTGMGMDTTTLSRIFEPFFTTKAATQGTGIGLATLKSIVKDYGGDVSVVSEPHRGSQFTILLPSLSV